MAIVHAQEKEYRTADSLWTIALADADFEVKVAIYQARAEISKERGLYEKAVEYTKLKDQMADSVKNSQRREETLLAQKQYEQQQTENKKDMISRVAAGAVSALALLLIVFFVYHKVKSRNSRKALEEIRKSRDEYSEKLAVLSASEKLNARDIRKLNSKIRELNDRQSEILVHGNALYNGIVAGGNTGKWKSRDISDFVEAYRFRCPDAVSNMEQTYTNLTPTKQLFLILTDMKYGDEDIRRIMCKSDGAIRTLKSRINSAKTTPSSTP